MARPKILIDTNILLRLPRLAEQSSGTMLRNLTAGFQPCIVFQNLTEFWSVATRPVQFNGFGLSIEAVSRQIMSFREMFEMIPEIPETVDTWALLCTKHRATGKRVHDVRLAATALSNGIDRIMTNNPDDFKAITNLTIYTAEDISKLSQTGAKE